MKRLAFLGAMNRDLVADIPGDIVLQKLGIDARPLVETPVSDAIAESGADLLATLGAHDYLGGSAFNAARITALLDADQRKLDLSFLGIAGQIGQGTPHLAALAEWHIATSGIQQSPLPPATCLAMVENAGRTLLTATGANAGIAEYLRDPDASLAQHIADNDIIHITSYLDPAAPGLMADLLASARCLNPALIVSLDPGAAWVMPGGEGFARLLAQTDILHLNHEELSHFGDDAPQILGARLRQNDWLIVARTHHGVTLHQSRAGQSPVTQKLPDTPLPRTILDSTGAGDTFCGAFLWHLCATSAAPLEAARQGFALARAKIAIKGPLSAAHLPI